jgi:carbon storage regulator
MLILTRRPGERVVIGEEILVTVMGVSGHTVRLGIAAPEGIPIYREEIWLAVMEENRAAAEANVDALPAEGAPLPADAPPVPDAEAPAQASVEDPPTGPSSSS